VKHSDTVGNFSMQTATLGVSVTLGYSGTSDKLKHWTLHASI